MSVVPPKSFSFINYFCFWYIIDVMLTLLSTQRYCTTGNYKYYSSHYTKSNGHCCLDPYVVYLVDQYLKLIPVQKKQQFQPGFSIPALKRTAQLKTKELVLRL